MPLLGGLLRFLFGGLLEWIARVGLRRIAVGVATFAAFGVAIGAMVVALRSALLQMAGSMFGGVVTSWVGLAFPSPAATTVTSLVITTWGAATLYKWRVKGLDQASTAGK